MYRPIEFMERCRAQYGRIISLQLGPASNVFVIADPAAAKQVLTAEPRVLPGGRHEWDLPGCRGESLDPGDGRPRASAPPANPLPVVGRHAQRYRELIAGIARERIATWEEGSEIRLLGEMEAISFEVMMRIAMGTDGRANGRLSSAL